MADAGIRPLLDRLADALRRQDGNAIRDAMAQIAQDVCAHPRRASSYIQAAVSATRDEGGQRVDAAASPGGSQGSRIGHMILGALGRCGDVEVLRTVATLLEQDDTAPNLRVACVMSLGQRRDLAAEGRAGAGYQWEAMRIDAPPQEPFVRDLFNDLLQRAAAKPGDPSLGLIVLPLCFAIAAIGAEDPKAIELLLSMARDHRTLRMPVLLGLQLAGSAPRAIQFARETMTAGDATDPEVTSAAGLVARADPVAFLQAISRACDDPSATPARVAALLGGGPTLISVGDDAISSLEAACSAALRWTRNTPVAVVSEAPRSVPLPRSPGMPDPTRLRTSPVVYGFVKAALDLSRGRSRAIPPMAAESSLLLLEAIDEPRDVDVAKVISTLLASGSETIAAEVLRASRMSRLDARTMASLLSAVWTNLRADEQLELRGEFDQLVQRLPEAERASVERVLSSGAAPGR